MVPPQGRDDDAFTSPGIESPQPAQGSNSSLFRLESIDTYGLDLDSLADDATPWYFRFPQYKQQFRLFHNVLLSHTQRRAGRKLDEDEVKFCTSAAVDGLISGRKWQLFTTMIFSALPAVILARRHRAGIPTRFFQLTGPSAAISRLTMGSVAFYFGIMPATQLAGVAAAFGQYQTSLQQSTQLSEALQQHQQQLHRGAIGRSDSSPKTASTSNNPATHISPKQLQQSPHTVQLDKVDLSLVDDNQLEQTRNLLAPSVQVIKQRLANAVRLDQQVISRSLSAEEVRDYALAFARARQSAWYVEEGFFWTCCIPLLFTNSSSLSTQPTRLFKLTGPAAQLSRFALRTLPIFLAATIISATAQQRAHIYYTNVYSREYPGLSSVVAERYSILARHQQDLFGMAQQSNLTPDNAERHETSGDDASPTMDSLSDEWDNPSRETSSSLSSMLNHEQDRSSSSTVSPDFWDDASPTSEPPLYENTLPKKEGAWDRLRRRAVEDRTLNGKSRSLDPRQQQQRHSDTSMESSFSSTDEDQELARVEAQKDFDSRVEQERLGHDFNERPFTRPK